MTKKEKLRSMTGRFFKTYIVDALSYMAMGLFCSLILGLIIKQISLIPGLDFLYDIAALLQSAPVVGASIGLAIALGLKRANLVTISAVAVGALGYQFGGPVGAYLASIVGVEAGSIVSKRTPVDIIITPLVAVVAGGLFAKYCCAPINEWVMSLGEVINRATMLNPFIMGVVVSVSVGCILTLPISSAALCISIGRCCDSRLLCLDDRLCCDQLQGQWYRRAYLTRSGHVNAAGRKYCAQACHMACSDTYFSDSRTGFDNVAQDDQ